MRCGSGGNNIIADSPKGIESKAISLPSPEEGVRRQPGAKTTMNEELLAEVRMAREKTVAARKGTEKCWAVMCAKEEPEKKNENE